MTARSAGRPREKPSAGPTWPSAGDCPGWVSRSAGGSASRSLLWGEKGGFGDSRGASFHLCCPSLIRDAAGTSHTDGPLRPSLVPHPRRRSPARAGPAARSPGLCPAAARLLAAPAGPRPFREGGCFTGRSSAGTTDGCRGAGRAGPGQGVAALVTGMTGSCVSGSFLIFFNLGMI